MANQSVGNLSKPKNYKYRKGRSEPNLSPLVLPLVMPEETAVLSHDPGAWPVDISRNDSDILVRRGPKQIIMDFPVNKNGRRFTVNCYRRRMANGEEVSRSWLIYSVSKDAIYCFCCRIFSKVRLSLSSEIGFNDWKHMSELLTEHERSPGHMKAFQSWKECSLRLEMGKTIDAEHQKMIQAEVGRWQESYFNEIRSDKGFEEMLVDAREVAESLEVEPSFPSEQQVRPRRVKRQFDDEVRDEAVVDPKVNFRSKCYLYILDTTIASLEERFSQLSTHNDTFGFLYKLKREDINTLMTKCADLQISLTDGEHRDVEGHQMYQELLVLKTVLPDDCGDKPKDILKFISSHSLSENFPNVCVALRILISLPDINWEDVDIETEEQEILDNGENEAVIKESGEANVTTLDEEDTIILDPSKKGEEQAPHYETIVSIDRVIEGEDVVLENGSKYVEQTNNENVTKIIEIVGNKREEETIFEADGKIKCSEQLSDETTKKCSEQASDEITVKGVETIEKEIVKNNDKEEIDEAKENKNMILKNNKDALLIPSPFKSILFWPDGSTNKKSGRVVKEKVPSVCSSEQWKEYYLKKENEKTEKENAILDRKKKREEKKLQLQEEKEKRSVKKLYRPSAVEFVKKNIFLNGKNTEDNSVGVEKKETTPKSEINVTDYVIVRYEGEKFPGKVKKISNYNGFFVSAMVASGLNYWKWPSEPDELWYSAEDIVEKINIPTPINNREFIIDRTVDIEDVNLLTSEYSTDEFTSLISCKQPNDESKYNEVPTNFSSDRQIKLLLPENSTHDFDINSKDGEIPIPENPLTPTVHNKILKQKNDLKSLVPYSDSESELEIEKLKVKRKKRCEYFSSTL
ncbi:unnamed protein product [Diabrotica balteata]|uniref:TTF-type domain-containing protein n=1 Tax=Diabrotica balteata TaxID=107213 RepID=A0A9N9XAD2_DIABA|nr:unnamed protein product [Diabrotica balteata]